MPKIATLVETLTGIESRCANTQPLGMSPKWAPPKTDNCVGPAIYASGELDAGTSPPEADGEQEVVRAMPCEELG